MNLKVYFNIHNWKLYVKSFGSEREGNIGLIIGFQIFYTCIAFFIIACAGVGLLPAIGIILLGFSGWMGDFIFYLFRIKNIILNEYRSKGNIGLDWGK